MKRLIDEELRPDASDRWLADLVRATSPLAPAPLQQNKIFALVASPAVPRRLWVGKTGAVAVTLGVAVAAAAAAPRAWFHPPARAVAGAGDRASAALAPAANEAPAGISAAQAASSEAVAAIPERSLERPSHPSHRAEATVKSGEDPALVLEAIRALRNHGDGVRAGTLLASYLKTHPAGVLVEDAMALSIEAAIARHDDATARELARRYVAQFPGGRFRAFATRAAQGPRE